MIRSFSLAEAAIWLGLPPLNSDRTFSAVSTDTRSLSPGALFVAVRGENFDGHRFIEAAEAAGAVAAVVDHPVAGLAMPQLVVPDTVAALARLALANRRESTAKIVAVTGSNGKTTVKEMLAAMLSCSGPTLATMGNLNNHIGVPQTLFNLRPEHGFGVIELGASAVGEIAHTVAATEPEVGIITNAGDAHLEGFGSYENIVLTKGEIIDGVAPGGTVVLNADDPACESWRLRAGNRRVRTVSRHSNGSADYTARLQPTETGSQHLSIHGPEGWSCDVILGLAGQHNITNALLAIAAVRAVGLPDSEIRAGLAKLAPVKGRLQPFSLGPAIDLIDDSYNANPSSMKVALEVLATRPGKRIAVLGRMAELGPGSHLKHKEIGVFAQQLGIDLLIAVGPGCEGYAEGFGDGAVICKDHGDAVAQLLNQLEAPVTVLIKGSRSSAMDRVADGVKG
ncbi:MAG: UDP-N-acetylmuramoyl-tripeptide--D-alanyl-D-alanine ligase [Oleiphilaceae bacterium]|nr:UDP-N-acetylmuramoyl-tripeptide--D-alanyl-D-alanine ligase [Oleiphilaceae bacterium]